MSVLKVRTGSLTFFSSWNDACELRFSSTVKKNKIKTENPDSWVHIIQTHLTIYNFLRKITYLRRYMYIIRHINIV